MKNNLETSLRSYYEQFSVGQEQRRGQLLRSLSAFQGGERREPASCGGGRRSMSQTWKSGLALAAGLMIVVGAIFYVWPDNGGSSDSERETGAVSLNPLSPQEAYASAIDRIAKLKSLRFLWTTPNGGKSAKIEMWWRRPNDYRMQFASNGLIVVSQGETLITDPRALFALSQLGRYFLLNQPLDENQQELFVQAWLQRCRIVESESVIYKGEKCLKVICVDNQDRYEYIIDAQKGTDIEVPFYELKRYNQPAGGRLLSHIEVLEVNREYADRIFTVE